MRVIVELANAPSGVGHGLLARFGHMHHQGDTPFAAIGDVAMFLAFVLVDAPIRNVMIEDGIIHRS